MSAPIPIVQNRHLVAIDASSSEPRVIVCRPPTGPLSREEALSFSAHLVATTNTALAAAKRDVPSPLDFARRMKSASKPAPRGAHKDESGKVTVTQKLGGPLGPDDALQLAAELAFSADPDADMVAHVARIVEAARGGRALDDVLSKEGHAVKLGPATRMRLDDAIEVAKALEAEDEAEAAEERKKMQR